jgi:hypothetical protein
MDTNAPIRFLRSFDSGKAPTPEQLPFGLIAINHYDGDVYVKRFRSGIGTDVVKVGFTNVGVVTYVDFAGIATYASVSGVATYADVSGISTVAQGLTGNPAISVSDLNVSGVSTLGIVQISSGIVTSTSGVVTYYGDGSKLQNIISGVGIQSTGTVIGTGITTLNFTGLGNTFSVDGNTVNINISGNTNISYASTTRTLSSSTGIGTELPLVSTSSAGLQAPTGFGSITYAAQVALDLAVLAGQVNTITLTGALELTTSNLANGRVTGLRLIPGASARDLTFPADWKFVSAKPASLPADKVARLTIECHGTTNADVVAAIAIQP